MSLSYSSQLVHRRHCPLSTVYPGQKLHLLRSRYPPDSSTPPLAPVKQPKARYLQYTDTCRNAFDPKSTPPKNAQAFGNPYAYRPNYTFQTTSAENARTCRPPTQDKRRHIVPNLPQSYPTLRPYRCRHPRFSPFLYSPHRNPPPFDE